MTLLGFSGWKFLLFVCIFYGQKSERKKGKFIFIASQGKAKNKQNKTKQHTYVVGVIGVRMVTCEFESEKGHINNLNLSKKLNIFHMNK